MGLRDYLRDLFTEPEPIAKAAATPGPTQPVGVSGQSVYGGWLQTNERSADLAGLTKWRKFDEWKRNVAAVGAAMRSYLVLIGSPTWDVEPYVADDADEPTPADEELARWARSQLHDMATPWATVVQVAALAMFDGYALQAWTAKRLPDGRFGLADVEWRPPHTIERWDMDPTGTVLGVVQRSPQDGTEIPIERARLVYSRDLPTTDSPEGCGVMRHLAESIREMEVLRRLRNKGFEKDVNGVPIAYAPILAKRALIDKADDNGVQYTQAMFDAEMAAVQTFVSAEQRKHAGLVLDSSPYPNPDGTLSSVPLFKAEVLSVPSRSHSDLGEAIRALAWDMLMVIGFEHLMLGADGAGSLAMHASKIAGTLRIVTSVLNRTAETMRRDLLRPLWMLNGLDPATVPTLTWDALEFADLDKVVASISALFTAAAVEPGRADDAVAKILANLGLPPLAEPDPAELMLRRQQAQAAAGITPKPAVGDKPKPGGDKTETPDPNADPLTKGMGSILDED